MKGVLAIYQNDSITTENTNQARQLYETSRYGTLLPDGRVNLSAYETLYLIEKQKISLVDGKNTPLTSEHFGKKAVKGDKEFWIKYAVFKDLRNRGYIVKTALKFGANFRVYNRGIKPGEEHAKWIAYPVKESATLTWHDFAAKNRVAHSTKKNLLIAVVDDEHDISYWEVAWLKP